jgi:hypothetical protein
MAEKCIDCCFFDAQSDPHRYRGKCHFNPPDKDVYSMVWGYDDWCGRLKKAKPLSTKMPNGFEK